MITAKTVLDRSLMLLQIAQNDHEIDGLTPSEIAKILTDKFRVRTTSAAVSMALGKATNLVNRTPEGQGFRYQIMSPGEEYLAHPDDANNSAPKRKSKRARVPGKNATNAEPTHSTKSKSKGSSRATKASSGKIGPKAAVRALIDSGYFSQARTGPEVQEFLGKMRGQSLGTDQLRVAMLRLVRDGNLDRDENDDGNYEYTAPKS